MGFGSAWHWIIVGVLVLVLFGGRGKISELMGDFAKGIKSFKKGLSEDETAQTEQARNDPGRTIDHQAAPPTAPTNAGAPGGAPVSGTEARKA